MPTDVRRRRQLFDDVERRLAEERRRIVDEREALRVFRRELERIPLAATRPLDGVPPVHQTPSESDRSLRAVREAYEATVMSVPHYAEEYDDTYTRSLSEEFGPDVALRLTRGDALGEPGKQALCSAIADSLQRRAELLEATEREAESITTAREVLLPIVEAVSNVEDRSHSACSFGTLEATYARLDGLEEDCTELLDTRQSTLVRQRRELALPIEGPDLPSYLYRELDVNYPVVSTIASLLEGIAETRAEIERAISDG